MATRSLIGIQIDKNTVKCSYCHCNGYPDYNGRILIESYTDKKKIMELISKGSFSALAPVINKIHYYGDAPDEMGNINVSITQYFSKIDMFGEDYRYIYTLDKEWKVYNLYEDTVDRVSDILY